MNFGKELEKGLREDGYDERVLVERAIGKKLKCWNCGTLFAPFYFEPMNRPVMDDCPYCGKLNCFFPREVDSGPPEDHVLGRRD
jgi:hypothetical protein